MGLQTKKIQCDEIWSFVYSKEKNKPEGIENAGDVWTWTAIDADSKLIIAGTLDIGMLIVLYVYE